VAARATCARRKHGLAAPLALAAGVDVAAVACACV
jgi:hypothetical protein